MTAYEVRCPRCDVSFPVETRTCFHCGGATGPAKAMPERMSEIFAEQDDGYEIGSVGEIGDMGASASDAPQAIDVLADSPFGSAAGSAEPTTLEGDRSAPTEEGAAPVAKSLLRSLPSVIWVVLLVGFSLARSCGNG